MAQPCVNVAGPCRETLQLMPEGSAEVLYFLFAASLTIIGVGFWMKFQVYQRGGKEVAWDHPWLRAQNFVRVALLQTKTARKKYAGPMHLLIFWGFIVLFIGTVLVLIDYDITLAFFHWQFLKGHFYLVFEFLLDIFGVLYLIGLGMAIRRRFKNRPEALQNKFQDAWILGTLALLGVQGFLVEAVRLAIRDPPWAAFSFVGHALAYPFQPLDGALQLAIYRTLWWFHALTFFAWFSTIPFTKMEHIITSPLNVFFGTQDVTLRKGELPTPFDLRKALETGNLDLRMGAQRLEDFTWRQLLSFDACTECGRCQDACPAYAAGRPLSPMQVILNLRDEMNRQVGDAWRPHGASAPVEAGNQLVEAVVRSTTLWSCVTCRACMEACPVQIEHVPVIVEMRRGLVMESRIDGHMTRLLNNLTNTGNAYGFPAQDRAKWADGLDVPVLGETDPAEPLEALYFVGCAGSYDARNQRVSRALVRVLKAAGVRFAILGPLERCNGDPARRLGEEGRFQELVMANAELFRKYQVKKVIAQCPHCFNTLKNEYRRFGVELEVEHHSQFIERLLREGRLKLARSLPQDVTFHDPCYLGRYNDEYEAPRRLLQIARGTAPVEMPRHGSHSFCCGAGGSNMWFEVKEERERISVLRFKEAQTTGVQRLGTACPFCMTMFEDAKGIVGETKLQVRDVAELVADCLTVA